MNKLSILTTIVIILMMATQAYAATCGIIASAPSSYDNSNNFNSDSVTLTDTTGDTSYAVVISDVAANTNTANPNWDKCSDTQRVIGYYDSKFDYCSSEVRTPLKPLVTANSIINLWAGNTDFVVQITNKATGAITCEKRVFNTGLKRYDIKAFTADSSDNVYAVGQYDITGGNLIALKISSACAITTAVTIDDATAALYAYPNAIYYDATNNLLNIGITRGADMAAIVLTNALVFNDYSGFGQTTGDGKNVVMAGNGVNIILTSISDTNKLIVTNYYNNAGAITLLSQFSSNVNTGFTSFVKATDVAVSTSNIAYVGLQINDAPGLDRGVVLATNMIAGTNVFMAEKAEDRTETTSVALNSAETKIVATFKNLDGSSSIDLIDTSGNKLNGKKVPNTVLNDAVFAPDLSDFTSVVVYSAGISWGKPAMSVWGSNLNEIANYINQYDMNSAVFIAVDSVTPKLATLSLSGSYGVQAYIAGSTYPNPAPEFSLTTLLLATLLAGGLVLFVVRRRYK